MPPVITIVKFHRNHPDPGNTKGPLHNQVGSTSEGFLRGTGLTVGDTVNVNTRSNKKTWQGSITEKFTDTYGDGWFFTVTCKKHDPDSTSTPGDILVTVVNEITAQASNQLLAEPQPSDVP